MSLASAPASFGQTAGAGRRARRPAATFGGRYDERAGCPSFAEPNPPRPGEATAPRPEAPEAAPPRPARTPPPPAPGAGPGRIQPIGARTLSRDGCRRGRCFSALFSARRPRGQPIHQWLCFSTSREWPLAQTPQLESDAPCLRRGRPLSGGHPCHGTPWAALGFRAMLRGPKPPPSTAASHPYPGRSASRSAALLCLGRQRRMAAAPAPPWEPRN